MPLELGPPKSRRCRVRPDRYLSLTHSPCLYVSISTVTVTQTPEEGARAAHPLVILFIRPTRNGAMPPTKTTGGPLARAPDALQYRPGPTIDMNEGGHPHSIVTAIPAPDDGGRRRLVGVVHTTLTAALFSNREVPDGVRAPLGATALPAPTVTSGRFLTVHPHATHTPNRTPLLKTLPSPRYQK